MGAPTALSTNNLQTNYFAVLEPASPGPKTTEGSDTSNPTSPIDAHTRSTASTHHRKHSSENLAPSSTGLTDKPGPAGAVPSNGVPKSRNSRRRRSQRSSSGSGSELQVEEDVSDAALLWRKAAVKWHSMWSFTGTSSGAKQQAPADSRKGQSRSGSPPHAGSATPRGDATPRAEADAARQSSNTDAASKSAQSHWRKAQVRLNVLWRFGAVLDDESDVTAGTTGKQSRRARRRAARAAAAGACTPAQQQWKKAISVVKVTQAFASAARQLPGKAVDTVESLGAKAVDSAALLGVRAVESAVALAVDTPRGHSSSSAAAAPPASSALPPLHPKQARSGPQRHWRKAAVLVKATNRFRSASGAASGAAGGPSCGGGAAPGEAGEARAPPEAKPPRVPMLALGKLQRVPSFEDKLKRVPSLESMEAKLKKVPSKKDLGASPRGVSPRGASPRAEAGEGEAAPTSARALHRTPSEERLYRAERAKKRFRRSVNLIQASNRFLIQSPQSSPKQAAAGEGLQIPTPPPRASAQWWYSAADSVTAQLQAKTLDRAPVFWQSMRALVLAVVLPVLACWLCEFGGLIGSIRAMQGDLRAFPAAFSVHVPGAGEGGLAAPDEGYDFARVDASLIAWQRELTRLHRDGLHALGGQVVSVEAVGELDFDLLASQGPGGAAGARGWSSISRLVAWHMGLSLLAYTTQHPGVALGAVGMNLPLLWLCLAIKRLEGALDDVVEAFRAAQVDLVLLPLHPTLPGQLQAHALCIQKSHAVVQHWKAQSLGILLEVPGMGAVELNLAAMVSVLLASAATLWVFGQDLYMLPHLADHAKVVIINWMVRIHATCGARLKASVKNAKRAKKEDAKKKLDPVLAASANGSGKSQGKAKNS